MSNKEKLHEWKKYFGRKLRKGLSWNEIRYELIFKNKYSARIIEPLINNYKNQAEAEKKKRIQRNSFFAAVILILMGTMYINQQLTITGMVIGGPGDVFYVDATNGNDNNNGLSPENPIKTIAKVNTLPIDPGDSVLFKRGELWRCPEDAYLKLKSGNSLGRITYGAYGVGNKPIFLGSLEINKEDNWANSGSENIWIFTNSIPYDVGNIIFNNNSSGIREESSLDLDSQGEFYSNISSGTLQIYSITNPSSYYTDIELALGPMLFSLSGKSYLNIYNISLMYGGSGAIGCVYGAIHYVDVISNEVSYFGGTYQSGTLRVGNGIGFCLNTSNVYVAHNKVSEIWDAGISPQAWSSPGPSSIINHRYEYNIVSNCAYGFEYFNSHTDSITRNVSVEHNTFVNSGRGWPSNQGGNSGRGLRLARTPIDTTEFIVRDNIIFNSTLYEIELGNSVTDAWKGDIISDYNLFGKGGTYLIGWKGLNYQNLATFKSAINQEIHGSEGNPIFVDTFNEDYIPQPDSPACSMSSTGSYVGALPCGSPSVCGDEVCDGDEDCSSCESDCGVCPPINHLPTQSAPLLNASDYPNNRTDALLACYNQSTADEDNDSVTNIYRWFRNNSLISDLTSDTVDASYTSAGESWKCEIRPYDGIGYGIAINSSALIILADCGNSICESGERCNTCELDCGECPPNISISSCNLENHTWNEDENQSNVYNLSSCFDDPLNQTLTFTSTGTANIIASIDSNGMVNLSAPTNWNGIEHIIFNASAGNRSAITNNITLTINPVVECGDAVCESGETCNTCSADCGICPEQQQPSRSGGGGGGGSKPDNEADWDCGEWSECINGKQTQTCVHNVRDADKTNTKSCSVAGTASKTQTTKQEEIKTSTTTPTKENIEKTESTVNNTAKPAQKETPGVISGAIENNQWPNIILTIIIIAFLGAFVYNSKKKPKSWAEQKNDQSQEEDHMARLKRYVKESAKRGYTKSYVKASLLNAGWNQSVIETILKSQEAEFIPEQENHSDNSKLIITKYDD